MHLQGSASPGRKRPWKGIGSANQIADRHGAARPVDPSVLLLEPGRPGDPGLRLRGRRQCVFLQPVDNVRNRIRPQFPQPIRKLSGRLVGPDSHHPLEQQISRVHARGQAEYAYPCFSLSPDNRPVDRGRSPVPGQQRRVKVNGSELWNFQHDPWQYCERNHHEKVGIEAPEPAQKVPRIQQVWLQYRKRQSLSGRLYGRRHQLPPPSPRTVRPGHDRGDFVAASDKALQGRHREIRRPHKHQLHDSLRSGIRSGRYLPPSIPIRSPITSLPQPGKQIPSRPRGGLPWRPARPGCQPLL